MPFSFCAGCLSCEFLARFFAAETLLCWMIFARKAFADAGYHVYGAIKKSLEEGRKAIAWYVGRDTAELSEEGVIAPLSRPGLKT